MYKFAHIADCHLGANRDPSLEKLELTAFRMALETCIKERVDFILITGDLFHANIPDMSVANEAVKIMKEVRDTGIPIYVIYGSHDYSPNETSMIDILGSAGLITKIVKGDVVDNKLKLKWFTDKKTGAKFVGISARKMGLEKKYFEMLDRELLENENGFKIFAFHSLISEIKPDYLVSMESIPTSLLPKGFNYYAGGHLHSHAEISLPEHKNIVYPGTLFAGYSRDLENAARGDRRGFYIVNFEDGVKEIKFVEVPVCEYLYFEYDASNKNSLQAQKELFGKIREIQPEGKVVIVKIKGELSGGKTSDLSSSEIKNFLMKNGAIFVSINRYGLTSKEYSSIKIMGQDIQTIENNLLRENIGAVKVSNEALKGGSGVKLAYDLLKVLRLEQKLNESKKDYQIRIQKQALDFLGLTEDLK